MKKRIKEYKNSSEVQKAVFDIRVRSDLLLRDIAKYCHVSMSAVKNWASGRTDISKGKLDLLNKLANSNLELDRNELLKELGLKPDKREVKKW